MLTLGLNISGHISSAALAGDGTLLGAACEERFSRSKRDRSFPVRAIGQLLTDCRLAPDAVGRVTVAWNPARNLLRNQSMLSEANASRGRYLAYVPNMLFQTLGGDPGPASDSMIFGRRIVYLDHHLAHAASACLCGPWDRCAFVTIDAFGEQDSLTIGRYEEGRFAVCERIGFPHSVGSFYSYLTEFLGFSADADEYKVMALGAFADASEGARLRDRLARTYDLSSGAGALRFALDLRLFDHYLFHRPHDFGPLAEVLGQPPRRQDEPLESCHLALAWALQDCFERIVNVILRHARRVTGERNACLAGGCLMNSLANGRFDGPPDGFSQVHIPAWPDDSGTAIGAALWGPPAIRHEIRHAFLGPSIDGPAAERAFLRRRLPFRRLERPEQTAAALVAAGEVIGHADGRMEFGQRALGNRSILADPRRPDIRRHVNERVKQREWFRPYAASVIADRAAEVFDLPEGFRADFMERVRPVRPSWRDRIPDLVHADGSVRLHLVEEEVNPRLHAILSSFCRLTGVPLLLNTSFNVDGEPIVCSADQAVACFLNSGLDSLVIGDLLARKEAFGLPELPG